MKPKKDRINPATEQINNIIQGRAERVKVSLYY